MSSNLSSNFLQFKVEISKGPNHSIYRYDEIGLDAEKMMFYREGQEVLLPLKVAKTLAVLVENGPRRSSGSIRFRLCIGIDDYQRKRSLLKGSFFSDKHVFHDQSLSSFLSDFGSVGFANTDSGIGLLYSMVRKLTREICSPFVNRSIT